MSDFINQTTINSLQKHNSELITENSHLKSEISDLKNVIEHLTGENPDYIKNIKKKVNEYETREEELKNRILAISKETESKEKKHKAVKALLSSLKAGGMDLVEGALDQYFQRTQYKSLAIGGILGIVTSFIVWCITSYMESQ